LYDPARVDSTGDVEDEIPQMGAAAGMMERGMSWEEERRAQETLKSLNKLVVSWMRKGMPVTRGEAGSTAVREGQVSWNHLGVVHC
jgi:hypothetical protein